MLSVITSLVSVLSPCDSLRWLPLAQSVSEQLCEGERKQRRREKAPNKNTRTSVPCSPQPFPFLPGTLQDMPLRAHSGDIHKTAKDLTQKHEFPKWCFTGCLKIYDPAFQFSKSTSPVVSRLHNTFKEARGDVTTGVTACFLRGVEGELAGNDRTGSATQVGLRTVEAGLGGHDDGASGVDEGVEKASVPLSKRGRLAMSDCPTFSDFAREQNENSSAKQTNIFVTHLQQCTLDFSRFNRDSQRSDRIVIVKKSFLISLTSLISRNERINSL